MDQLYYAARTLNQLVISVVLALVLCFVMAPGVVGTWMAQRDVAYDRIWMNYVGDCDCTSSFE
jgi:hypothetical protein